MSRLALLTDSRLPRLHDDDRLLLGLLRDRGIEPVPLVWNDPAVAWDCFDAVLIRSPWDYFLELDRFLTTLRAIEDAGVPLLNPSGVAAWNADKVYLLDLVRAGVTTPASTCIPRGVQSPLTAMLDKHGGRDLVLKPMVSGGGYRTVRVNRANALEQQAVLDAITAEGDALIQTFQPEIETDGELSLIFIEGDYSHACRKRARAGEFRVQTDHGGTVHTERPSDDVIRQAKAVLDTAQRVYADYAGGSPDGVDPLLYARVDGVVDGEGRFVLMELELIEPELFFRVDSHAAARFADAVAARIG